MPSARNANPTKVGAHLFRKLSPLQFRAHHKKAPFHFARMTLNPSNPTIRLQFSTLWKSLQQCVCLICNPSSTNQNRIVMQRSLADLTVSRNLSK